MLAANLWIEYRVPDGEVRAGTEGTELVLLERASSVNWPNPLPPELHGTTNQSVHMEGPTASAAYVAEDDLVRHQWEERPLVL